MKNTQTLRQLFVENGMNKGWATRRANQAAKAGNLYVNALIWGVKTFKTAAPYRVSDIENENVFKGVAHYAYNHSATPMHV